MQLILVKLLSHTPTLVSPLKTKRSSLRTKVYSSSNRIRKFNCRTTSRMLATLDLYGKLYAQRNKLAINTRRAYTCSNKGNICCQFFLKVSYCVADRISWESDKCQEEEKSPGKFNTRPEGKFFFVIVGKWFFKVFELAACLIKISEIKQYL